MFSTKPPQGWNLKPLVNVEASNPTWLQHQNILTPTAFKNSPMKSAILKVER
jgi:hypothetical protein